MRKAVQSAMRQFMGGRGKRLMNPEDRVRFSAISGEGGLKSHELTLPTSYRSSDLVKYGAHRYCCLVDFGILLRLSLFALAESANYVSWLTPNPSSTWRCEAMHYVDDSIQWSPQKESISTHARSSLISTSSTSIVYTSTRITLE